MTDPAAGCPVSVLLTKAFNPVRTCMKILCGHLSWSEVPQSHTLKGRCRGYCDDGGESTEKDLQYSVALILVLLIQMLKL